MKRTAKRDGVDEESMLFRGANPLWLTLLAGLAAGKTGVTGALPRRSPQAFSYDVSTKEGREKKNRKYYYNNGRKHI